MIMAEDKKEFRPLKVLWAKELIKCGFYFDPEIIDYTDTAIAFARESSSLNLYQDLCDLSPSQFEHFVAGQFKQMGFDVQPTGPTSFRDGGIDLVAIPKRRTVGSCLVAVQVKHHQRNRKTRRNAVDRLLAWKDSHFRIAVLITNTGFTRDARWVADRPNNRPFIRLRDFEDLRRWNKKDYWSRTNWREVPDRIDLAPGSTVPIP